MNLKKINYLHQFKINTIPLEIYYDNQSASTDDDDDKQFQIDVQPKRKHFDTIDEKKSYIEEYTKKKKTELCKNFQLTKFCKFGDECSFAHGYQELQAKTHLHQKYKTKRCNRYFNEGFCPYGIRCQYLHENQQQLQKYLQEQNQLQFINPQIGSENIKDQERLDILRFQQVLQKFVKKGLNLGLHSRSKFFVKLEKKN
ncbi:unnamed protein product [Paramecium sonneborni]|uniref:C3H1-type domain-containing protein n=1 Tax=Paramecium sonneborni TaxID=65129 RepID=A0A8S1N2U8_9CILI|nr:unnamed protein product [Paramecium sonneborni]